MTAVRARKGIPTRDDFAGSRGTPIVVDEDTGRTYVLDAEGNVKACGVRGHGELSGNSGPNCHPVDAISGLQAALDGKQEAGEYASAVHGHSYVDLTNKPTLGTAAAKNVGTGANDVAAGDHTHPGGDGGPATWGAIEGTLGDQSDLQTALDGKADSVHNHDGTYSSANHNHDAAYAAVGHNHDAAYSAIGHNHAGTYEPADANIQTHVTSAHAPSNAQKNSDITKAEIEAKLTGEISSHTHAGGGADPWTYVRLASDFQISTTAAGDITGLGFTPAANTRYEFEGQLMLRTATATVNPRAGLAWPTGMTDGVANIDQAQSATAIIMARGNINAALLVAVGGLPNTTQSWPATVWGMAVAGATPSGNIRLQLASETAGTNVTAKAGSFLKFRTVP